MATAREVIRGLKAEFDVAHEQGMAALRRRDFSALHAAIQLEAAILAQQRRAIMQHVQRSGRLVDVLHTSDVGTRRSRKR